MTGPNPDMHKSRVSESCLKYDLEESLRVLGYLTCQNFQCLPLYGPRNTEDLKDAMGTFEIPFRAEDYGE